MTSRIRAALIAASILFPLAVPLVASAATQLHTIRVASGLSMPLFVTSPPGDTARVFIVEQRGADNRGRIKIMKNGVVLARAFLTTAVLSTGSEQGLLGLAFAPDYATSGRFYINYTRASDGATIVERHNVSADPDSANPTGAAILTISQPAANHNGGWLAFGPDGYLYMTTGDGGGAGDPGDRAEDLNNILGKILRLDVSGNTYTSPPSNPFFGATTGLDEIWAYGLRNPWRPSFDRLTGDLIIADVGQAAIEEIDFQPASSIGGENYGWRCYEGFSFFTESSTIACGSCLAPGCPKVFPHYQYDHSGGRCSTSRGPISSPTTAPRRSTRGPSRRTRSPISSTARPSSRREAGSPSIRSRASARTRAASSTSAIKEVRSSRSSPRRRSQKPTCRCCAARPRSATRSARPRRATP
jgi:hypothetical protein